MYTLGHYETGLVAKSELGVLLGTPIPSAFRMEHSPKKPLDERTC